MQLQSPAFADQTPIPRRYTADGLNESPPLRILDIPAAARTLVLYMNDPDAKRRTWTHWFRVGILPTTSVIAAGQPRICFVGDGSCQLANDFGWAGYGGPAPPVGETHRYRFVLFAVDRSVDVHPRMKPHEVFQQMVGHVIADTMLVGTYRRP